MIPKHYITFLAKMVIGRDPGGNPDRCHWELCIMKKKGNYES